MDQVKFVEDSLLGKTISLFKFFKGYLPLILFGPFLNNLTHKDQQSHNPRFPILLLPPPSYHRISASKEQGNKNSFAYAQIFSI